MTQRATLRSLIGRLAQSRFIDSTPTPPHRPATPLGVIVGKHVNEGQQLYVPAPPLSLKAGQPRILTGNAIAF
jgi:hypothetical protein